MEYSSDARDRKEAAPQPDRQADHASDRQAQGDRQAFGVQLPRPGDPVLRDLRGRYPPHYQGHRPRNSSWLLISYLESLDLTGRHVIDGGCGIASIHCAQRSARVSAVDIDPHVFPFVGVLCDLNEVTVEPVTAGFDDVTSDLLNQADLLIGADICFRAPMFNALFGLLQRGLAARISQVAITDPGRNPYRDLVTRCRQELGAQEDAWQTTEPLLSWPGARPSIAGRLLRIQFTQGVKGA